VTKNIFSRIFQGENLWLLVRFHVSCVTCNYHMLRYFTHRSHLWTQTFLLIARLFLKNKKYIILIKNNHCTFRIYLDRQSMMLTNERTGLNVDQSFHDKYYALALSALIMNVEGYGTCTLQFSTRVSSQTVKSESCSTERHSKKQSLF
jgi:hypothetical protein